MRMTGRKPKLDVLQAIDLRSRWKSGESVASLARRFGVDFSTARAYALGLHKNRELQRVHA